MLRFHVREQDYMPGIAVPDKRPVGVLVLKKDWGIEDTGLVQVSLSERVGLAVTLEEAIRNLARRGGRSC